MDENLRSYLRFYATDGFSIKSSACPQMYGESTLYVRGSQKESDLDIVSCDFLTEEKAKRYISRLKNCIAEFQKPRETT